MEIPISKLLSVLALALALALASISWKRTFNLGDAHVVDPGCCPRQHQTHPQYELYNTTVLLIHHTANNIFIGCMHPGEGEEINSPADLAAYGSVRGFDIPS